MQLPIAWEVQGHRGARGLAPENTLPSFEIALDWGVTAIETDVHLTKDDVAVLFHDARITERLCSPISTEPLVRSLTLQELRGYRISSETSEVTPLARRFAAARGLDPFGIPTVAELFEFVAAYTVESSKTRVQQERARRLWFDLELKRVPFEPETIGDGFDGRSPGVLERQVVDASRAADTLKRSRVRSFDHRSTTTIRQLEPTLALGLLVHHTAPAHLGKLLEAAGATLYCPEFSFVDGEIVEQVHRAGTRIIPYTVNEPGDWAKLLEMGVDGVTTDYPDRLIEWLAQRGVGVV